ncbi:uncharacterized protein F4822DRAFT_368481 [Hypoxylon trugodes]|uniref:uncharacterized protein n=1 Tax=Hypoxylon trugodes TaxID=326681 RepID=UPI00219768C2|nr:uncharacterized protein F4822DRAFT_368481 [Hypoxylon trugodes]KAI1384625.1 hypothetical protein F4822DRAFT_368481 [Hypoxylon trugodes]
MPAKLLYYLGMHDSCSFKMVERMRTLSQPPRLFSTYTNLMVAEVRLSVRLPSTRAYSNFVAYSDVDLQLICKMPVSNPNDMTDNCVFVTIGQLLSMTPEAVAEKTEYLQTADGSGGIPTLGEIRAILGYTGRNFESQEGNNLPPSGVTKCGLLYYRKNGSGHAVVMEKWGSTWLMYDYQHRSGRQRLDWNTEVDTVAMTFWFT